MTTLQRIDTNTLPWVAWKNGGGLTQTLAVFPEDSNLENFSWRISIAEVKESGKFSHFPCVDRIILLLAGKGMVLENEDGTSTVLAEPYLPHNFPGENSIFARLLDGATRDLNVMVRRDYGVATVQCWRSGATVLSSTTFQFYFCAQGEYRIRHENSFQDTLLWQGQACCTKEAAAGTVLNPNSDDAVLIGIFIQENL